MKPIELHKLTSQLTTEFQVNLSLYTISKDKEYIKSMREKVADKRPGKVLLIQRFEQLENNYEMAFLVTKDLHNELLKSRKREFILRDELLTLRKRLEKLEKINERLLVEIEKHGI